MGASVISFSLISRNARFDTRLTSPFGATVTPLLLAELQETTFPRLDEDEEEDEDLSSTPEFLSSAPRVVLSFVGALSFDLSLLREERSPLDMGISSISESIDFMEANEPASESFPRTLLPAPMQPSSLSSLLSDADDIDPILDAFLSFLRFLSRPSLSLRSLLEPL